MFVVGGGGRWGVVGEWIRGLGLRFTNPVGTGGVWNMCQVFGLRPCGWFRWGVGGDSQIQNCLRVGVRHRFVLTSPAFMRSSASYPAGPHDRLVRKKTGK